MAWRRLVDSGRLVELGAASGGRAAVIVLGASEGRVASRRLVDSGRQRAQGRGGMGRHYLLIYIKGKLRRAIELCGK